MRSIAQPKQSSSSDSGNDTDEGGSDGGDSNDDDNPDCQGCSVPTTTAAAASAAASTTSICAPSDTACNNCGLAWQTVYACADVFPDWSEFNDEDMAACLCYNPSPDDTSSLVWVPNQFDAPWDYCPQWASTMDPYDYSAYVDNIDFCTQVGNVLSVYSTDWAADYAAAATTADAATGSTTSSASGSGGNEANTASPAKYSLIQPVS